MSATIQPEPVNAANRHSHDAGGALVMEPQANGRLLLTVLELGVLGDLLLRAGGVGVNVTLWCWALLAAGGLMAREIAIDRRRLTLIAATAAFAAVPALRSDPVLVLFSGLAVIICLTLLTWTAAIPELVLAARTIGAYLGAARTAVLHILVGFVPILASEVRARSQLGPTYRKPLGAIARGVLFALPVLFIFGTLLTHADAAFATLVGGLFRWEADVVASHVILTGFFAWLGAAYLLANRRWRVFAPIARGQGFRVGAIETGTVIALVDLLFLTFVLVQARYLFGGVEHVMRTAGLTYADYARQGFFELVAVSALALPLLVGVMSGTRVETAGQRRTQHVLVATLVGLLLLMMASALGRMWLYQSEYGWTNDRLYATALMLWIGGSIIWFAMTYLRARPERFTVGSIAGGLLVLAALTVANPAAAIIRGNAERAGAGHDFDGADAAAMGADGIPALLAVLPRVASSLDEAERCAIRAALHRVAESSTVDGDGDDWRTFSLSRARARAALARHGTAAAAHLGGSGRCVQSPMR